MSFFEQYGKVLQELYDISNPIIKYKIDKEFYGKDNISIEQYISFEDSSIKYWLNTYNSDKIHGREDCAYENSIAKLLEYGLTKNDQTFNQLFSILLEDEHWKVDTSFEGILMKTVKYPFLIRAGYYDNKHINSYFHDRLQKIEKAIETYGYDFKDINNKIPQKYKDQFIFKFNNKLESLPTFYDLYAFAFYPHNNADTTRRIEKIVQYLLDEKFQNIPKKAYIHDIEKKRYYAAGNVYHACMIEERKLLTIFLLSHFKTVGGNDLFMNELKKLLSYRCHDGFYEFDKSLIKEKKDGYYIYSGSHMGLGEKRSNTNWRKIESTFWMLKILLNLETNNIEVLP
ncbi:hypothetical protein [Oceanirhabdus seepicola]|uniref:Uncharacterized protein n=1 Tax=Oceanirhabdus seepicola TaxID=2828781 RepID=A0A9J6P5N5_9CLOT|nr:hypothetical protein [Oceanirhabdus seepicola]MCM1991446.1 hypothetical protein [Oceanirhabdus seepicola]